MSAESFRVGDPIDGQVAKKIQSLQNTFGSKDDGQSRRNYIELQSAIPWIRMQSGVSLTEDLAAKYRATAGYDLAKKYVLFGLNRRIESTEGPNRTTYSPNFGDPIGYDYDSQFGFGHRPKPGIVDMNIHSHNRFGSLRTAVIRFQCWTRDQIDALEILYMRPGYSVLLEWGHSKILRIDGTGVIDMDLGIDLYEDGLNTATEVRERVLKKRTELQYGYDAILGVIKNFSWQVRPDGGYDCTTHLVTSGEIIESYKANFYLSQTVITKDLKEIYDEITQESVTKTIKWPTLHKDTIITDAPDLGDIQEKIDQWVSQAEQSMANRAQNLTNFAAEKSGEQIETYLKENLGSPFLAKHVTTNNASAVVQALSKVLGALKIVKGGDQLYAQTKTVTYFQQVYKDNNKYGPKVEFKKEDAPIQVANSWKYLVDFDEGKNGFGAGQQPDFTFPGGARAAWMIENPGKNFSLCEDVLKALEIKKEEIQNPIFSILAAAANLAKSIKNPKGEQIFFFNGALVDDTKGESTGFALDEKTVEDFYTNLEKQATPPGWRFPDYTLLARNIIAVDKIAGRDLYKNAEISVGEYDNAPVGTTYAALAAAANPAIKLPPAFAKLKVQKEDRSVTYNIPPGAARFIVIKWTGFNPEKAAQGQVITGQDENTGETYKYYDPNDDYTSKLHYYLRTKLHTPYLKSYLQGDFAGQSFTEVFKYRAAPEGIVDDIFNTTGAPTKRKTVPKDVRDGLQTVLGGRFFASQELDARNYVYIKLGALLELINKHTLRSRSEYFFTFQTTYTLDRYPKYFTFDDHISIDPRICILPHTAARLKIEGADKSESPKILNIELSTNYILDTLNRYITSEGKVAVYDYLQDILDGVVKATGGVNDYQLQYMEDDAVYHIVDRKVIAPNGITAFNDSQINVYGLNSIIRDVNLVSKLTPKITSMVAIAAQDSPFTSMDEGTGFNAINRGMTDRIYTERYDIESKTARDEIKEGQITAYKDFRDKLKQDIIGLITNLGFFYAKNTVPTNSADTMYGIYENYCKFLLGGKVIFDYKGRATYNFVLPFELQFKMYGVSGLKVMDAFLIDQTILPKTYGGDADKPVGFLVTGVEHSVNRSEWTTNIKSQIFNIGDNQQDEAKFESLETDLLNAVRDVQSGAGSVDCQKLSVTPYEKLSQETKNNVKFFYDVLIKDGFSVLHAKSIIAVAAKESALKPRPETSYKSTGVKRIREIFKKRVSHLTDLEIDTVKADDLKFWDLVYGITVKERYPDSFNRLGFYTDNGSDTDAKVGDGQKYLGRGFNGITGKAQYHKLNKQYKEEGSKFGEVDIFKNPENLNNKDDGIYKIASYFASMYYRNGNKSHGTPQSTNPEEVIFHYIRLTAGWGTSTNNNILQEGYCKAKKFFETLPKAL